MIKKYKKYINTKKRKILFFSTIVALFIFWFVPYVPALKWQSVTVTRWVKPEGKIRAEVGPEIKGWTPIGKISKHAIHAIIASEDSRFYTHSGLDFVEIINSAKRNIKEGKLARGGSTITQQVIKMAFLDREKTFTRKAREAIGAILLELILDKQEIMEWYINMAEFGDGVYGIERASWHYFKTKPHFLSIEQAIHLALVLPSPNGWSYGLRKKNLTKFGHKRFSHILKMMRASGFLTVNQYNQAMARGDFGSPIRGYTPPPEIAESPAAIQIEDESYNNEELQSEERESENILMQNTSVDKNKDNKFEKPTISKPNEIAPTIENKDTPGSEPPTAPDETPQNNESEAPASAPIENEVKEETENKGEQPNTTEPNTDTPETSEKTEDEE